MAVIPEEDDNTCSVYRGDREWHDGPGYYYVDDDYPDEGSCGAFATLEECIAHARAVGYVPTYRDGVAVEL